MRVRSMNRDWPRVAAAVDSPTGALGNPTIVRRIALFESPDLRVRRRLQLSTGARALQVGVEEAVQAERGCRELPPAVDTHQANRAEKALRHRALEERTIVTEEE